MDCTEGTLFYNSILSRIQGEIEAQARTLYFKICNTISISLDDLIQEGMIGAWKGSMNYDESRVKNEESFNGYCKQYAKGAMLAYIEKYKAELSLEAYLEVKTEKGTIYNDIEDRPVKCAETSAHKRQFVMTALNSISSRQRRVIMSAFQIEDEYGNITTRETTGMSGRNWQAAKDEGLKKLRSITTFEGLQIRVSIREKCRKLLQQDPTLKPRHLMQLTGCSKTSAVEARAELKLRVSAVS